MDCKNHSGIEGEFICTVCEGNYCVECISDEENKICSSCKEKQDVSQDILNDIMGSIIINEQAKLSFDTTDVLNQIEAEISLQQQKTNEELDDILSNVVSNEKIKASFDPSELLAQIETEDINSSFDKDTEVFMENFLGDEQETENSTSEFDTSLVSDNAENLTNRELFTNNSVNLSKENKISNIEIENSDNFKDQDNIENTGNIEKSESVLDKVKIQSSKVIGGVTSVVSDFKDKDRSLNSSKNNVDPKVDDILKKIENENLDGEYDDIIGKFKTSYGQSSDKYNHINDFLPLKINDIIYFLASLIPGMAQFYLGLTVRGTTIFVISAIFLVITQTASLFFIAAVLSFADAYKLRNIYYRGGNIVDSNDDIMNFVKKSYIIAIIIIAIIIDKI